MTEDSASLYYDIRYLAQGPSKGLELSRCDLLVSNNSCGVLRHEVGNVCDEWDVEVLGEEPTVVFEALTVLPKCANLGIDEEV